MVNLFNAWLKREANIWNTLLKHGVLALQINYKHNFSPTSCYNENAKMVFNAVPRGALCSLLLWGPVNECSRNDPFNCSLFLGEVDIIWQMTNFWMNTPEISFTLQFDPREESVGASMYFKTDWQKVWLIGRLLEGFHLKLFTKYILQRWHQSDLKLIINILKNEKQLVSPKRWHRNEYKIKTDVLGLSNGCSWAPMKTCFGWNTMAFLNHVVTKIKAFWYSLSFLFFPWVHGLLCFSSVQL